MLAYFIMIDYRTYEVAILRGSNTIYVCTFDITQAINKDLQEISTRCDRDKKNAAIISILAIVR